MGEGHKIGFHYKNMSSNSNSEVPYQSKLNKWVKVYTSDGQFEGNLEKITNTHFVLNPKLTLQSHENGWDQYVIAESSLEYDITTVSGMELKDMESTESFCYAQNLVNEQSFYNSLAEIGLAVEEKKEERVPDAYQTEIPFKYE